MSNLCFLVSKEIFGICRLKPDSIIPEWINTKCFYSITRTLDELSIVCDENQVPAEIECQRGWKALRVEGTLDFSLVGILSNISSILANSKVSIFAISTFDTDYILVKEKDLQKSIKSLIEEGYEVNI